MSMSMLSMVLTLMSRVMFSSLSMFPLSIISLSET